MPRARQQRLLLAALLAHPAQALGTDLLMEVLWDGDVPADAHRSVRVLVARLRRALAATGIALALTDAGYLLDVLPGEVDIGIFRAVGHTPDLPRPALDAALALWTGPPFGDLCSARFLGGVTAELTLLRDQMTGALHERRLVDEGPGAVLPDLARWADEHPLDEAAWTRYARALAAVGRPAEALRATHQLRAHLRGTSGLEPSTQVMSLEREVLGSASPEPCRPGASRVPMVTSPLLGRESDLNAVTELVRTRRLVSLTGPGGVGKTRLAIALALDVAPQFADGVQWCDLAGISDPDAVAAAVFRACGLEYPGTGRTIDSLIGGLAPRHSLVVLDNCEHVLDASRAIAGGMLRACSEVHTLVTSRVPLAVAGERVSSRGATPVAGS